MTKSSNKTSKIDLVRNFKNKLSNNAFKDKISNGVDTETEIKRITQQIVKNYKPEKIVLFGSFAWGRPTKDSDVDLFIVKTSRKRKIDRERELRRMLFESNFPAMDLLIYTPREVKKRLLIEDLFIKEILSKGKLLYAK